MGLEQIVNVNISRETASVSQAGFGIPLILGPNASFANNDPHSYASLPEVAEDFSTSTDEYKAALKAFAQNPKPKTVKIGKALAKVAQVVTVTPDVTSQAIAHFIQTIDGVDYDFTSDITPTAAEVVTGLIALINGDVDAKVTASGTTTLILTADSAGRSFSHEESANLVAVLTTPNVGAAESLAALSLVDDDWYALIQTSKADGDVLEAAAYIESVRKIYGVSRNDAGIKLAGTTDDIFSQLKDANYFRTFGFWSGDAANFPEAAMFGRFLPTTPGSELWAYKTFAGVTVDALTATEIAALKGKNVNFFATLAGNAVSREGKMAGGEWIDIIRLIDLIVARIQEAIFGSLIRNPKIPFTNGGISIIDNDVQGVLKANQKTGGIAPDSTDANGDLVPGYTTSFPNISDVSANDRAARTLTVADAFSAKLAGAIVAVEINGSVTV